MKLKPRKTPWLPWEYRTDYKEGGAQQLPVTNAGSPGSSLTILGL